MPQPSRASRKWRSATWLAAGGRLILSQFAPPSAVLKIGTPPLPTTRPSLPSALKRTCSGPGPSHVNWCCHVRPPLVVRKRSVGPASDCDDLLSAIQPSSAESEMQRREVHVQLSRCADARHVVSL